MKKFYYLTQTIEIKLLEDSLYETAERQINTIFC